MSRSVYEINQDILDCIDSETGEIVDFDKLEALNMELDAKKESIALWIKDLEHENENMGDEVSVLIDRTARNKAKIDSLKHYLATICAGERFATSKCEVTFRKSTVVEVDEDRLPAAWWKIPDAKPKPDKAAIKDALKNGETIIGAELVTKNNISIK